MNFQKFNILFLNNSKNEANWGCKATSKWLLRSIKNQFPNAQIKTKPVLFLDKKSQDKYLNEIPKSSNEFDSYIPDQLKTNPLFEDYNWADAIILNGEGGMHEYKPWRAEPYLRLLSVYAVKRFFTEKKILAVNQTVDYWNESFGTWVKVAYKNCDHLFVREPRSLKRLKSLGLKQTKLVPDTAFLTRSESVEKARRFLEERNIEKGYIGLFFGQTMGYAELSKIEDYFLKLRKFGFQVVLFAAPWPDHDVAQLLKEKYNAPVIGIETHPEMLCGILKEASIVSSGRFHCCILSALAGAPFVPFKSNTDKIEGLLELLDYGIPAMNFETINNEQIIKIVEGIWEDRNKIKNHLIEKVPGIVSATSKGYRSISFQLTGPAINDPITI